MRVTYRLGTRPGDDWIRTVLTEKAPDAIAFLDMFLVLHPGSYDWQFLSAHTPGRPHLPPAPVLPNMHGARRPAFRPLQRGAGDHHQAQAEALAGGEAAGDHRPPETTPPSA